MTKARPPQPINGWMATSPDTLVPYPLPVAKKKRRRKHIADTDQPSAMATTLTPRSMRTNIPPRPDQGVFSPRSMPAVLSPRAMATASQQLQDLTHKQYEERRRPRHIVFFRNGDPFFKGKKMLITPHRYTSLEDLLSELTRNMKLPYGVRQIFTPRGVKVRDIEELKDGESYVCASFEKLKRMKYGNSNNTPQWNVGTRRKEQNDEAFLYAHVPVGFSYPSSGKYAKTYNKSTFGSGHTGPGSFAYNRTHPGASTDSKAFGILHSDKSPIKPKVVKIVKTGAKPRKVVSLLINKRSVQSYEQLIQDVSDAFGIPKYKNNRIRKLYTLKGKEIKSLVDFYRDKDSVFVASPSRTVLTEDTFVDIYEELFPDSPHEQFFHRKKGKKRDSSNHDSEICDDEDKMQKNRRERNKGKEGDYRLEDGEGANKTHQIKMGDGSNFTQSANDTKKEEEEQKQPERSRTSSESMHEDIRKRELELLQKEEELRRKEEELKRKEESVRSRKDKERQEELAKKEAELKEKEEQFFRRAEEEKQKIQELLDAKREAEEAKLLEEAQAEKKTREEAERRVADKTSKKEEAERKARNERERQLADQKTSKHISTVKEQEKEQSEIVVMEEVSKISLDDKTEESKCLVNEAILDEDNKELEKLDNRLAKFNAEGLSSSSGDSNEIIYQNNESENPSVQETEDRFIHQLRTLVKKSDILVKYDIEDKIGDGNFADVHEAVHRETGELFALKIIAKAKLKNKEHMVENEIAIMKHIRHPNIVRLYEEFETRGHIYLVMEFVSGGDLFDAITESVKFTEADAALMVKDLASALEYLHDLNVVHRDLKPENLLVNKIEEGDITLKLADFGLAMEVKEPIFTVCGTPTYVAPEILAETGYGLEVDMWAIGVITYILLCGFPPFRSPDRDQEELFELIQAGKFAYVSPYWDNISSAAKDLIDHLLVVDKEKRYTAKQVLRHPWVTNGGAKGTMVNLQREVSMNLEKNFAGRRSARHSASRSARRKAGATQK